MIVIPNRCMFLFTPRTGGKALMKVFEQLPEAEIVGDMHTHPNEIPKLDLPKYTVIRDPYMQLLSWHATWRHQQPEFVDFLLGRRFGRSWARDRLNPYDGIADGYFIYEHGLPEVLRWLQLPAMEIPVVGKTDEKAELTLKAMEFIREYYARDLYLYYSVRASYASLSSNGKRDSRETGRVSPPNTHNG